MLARREGLFVHYRLSGPEVVGLVLALRLTAEQHLAEIDRVVADFFGDRNGFEPVAPDELARRMTNGEVVVLDVRPEQEFAAGHIASARSIPVAELRMRIREIPKRRIIVAYCRGPYCVFADQAVGILRDAGYKALRLDGGFPEWQMKGMPVERGAVEVAGNR